MKFITTSFWQFQNTELRTGNDLEEGDGGLI
jgi:hypothetical protein